MHQKRRADRRRGRSGKCVRASGAQRPAAAGTTPAQGSRAAPPPLVREADPGFHFVSPAQHYDGTYYYAIARDLLLRGREHTLIDQATYRYGHPLHGWLAGMLSFGQARAVPAALLLLSLIGLALAG